MTYSFKVRIDDRDKVDLSSLSKEEQKMVGQLVFRTMLENSGRCRGKKVEEVEERNNGDKGF